MEALVDENPVKRDAMKLYITLQNVASTADVVRRAVKAFGSRGEKEKKGRGRSCAGSRKTYAGSKAQYQKEIWEKRCTERKKSSGRGNRQGQK